MTWLVGQPRCDAPSAPCAPSRIPPVVSQGPLSTVGQPPTAVCYPPNAVCYKLATVRQPPIDSVSRRGMGLGVFSFVLFCFVQSALARVRVVLVPSPRVPILCLQWPSSLTLPIRTPVHCRRTGVAPPPWTLPRPPLPMLEADSHNFASAPLAPRGFKLQTFRPAFLGGGGPSQTPPPPPQTGNYEPPSAACRDTAQGNGR